MDITTETNNEAVAAVEVVVVVDEVVAVVAEGIITADIISMTSMRRMVE